MTERSYAENLENASRAMALVEDGYLLPLGLTGRAGLVHERFHFVEARRWAYYLRHVARFRVPKAEAGEVEAVTHSYGNSPKIGVNKNYHTFGTLVHESVHYFSHLNFRRSFGVELYEGATEYLARWLLGDFGPRRDVFGENDLYADEVGPFFSVIEDESGREELCRAYFHGHEDAINKLRDRLLQFDGSTAAGSGCG